jgi:hypothetical protein
VTRLGLTVVITNAARVPRVAPTDVLLGPSSEALAAGAGTSWHPERSPTGPVSIVISATDRRLIVLRNGVIIGSAPVAIDGPLNRASAFVMRNGEAGARTWLQVQLPGQVAVEVASTELRGRIHVDAEFRRSVEAVMRPGTTVVVTTDSLRQGSTGQGATLVEG